MKKIVITGIIAVGVVLGGTSVIGASMNDKTEAIVKDQAVQSEQFVKTEQTSNSKQMLSIDKVKKIALSEHDGHIEDIELEHDDGHTYYEVEIENGHEDYNLYIDAYTGKVLFVDKDDDDDNHDEKQNVKDIISADKAKEIAVNAVGGKVIDIELDEDDGRYEYEMELIQILVK